MDGDVNVMAEGVVPPDDVAQVLVVATIVRRVDDPLRLPGAPGMSATGAEQRLQLVGQRGQLLAPLTHPGGRLGEALAAPVLTSASEAIDSPTRCGSTSVPAAWACNSSKRLVERKRVGIEQRELLLHRHGEVACVIELFVRRCQLLVD